MKNFIVQFDTKPGLEMREGYLGGDLIIDACIPAISSTPIFIVDQFLSEEQKTGQLS